MQNPPWWEAAFLKALAETGIVTKSAKAVGITARAASKRRAANPTFAAAWEGAVALHRSEQGRAALSAAGGLAVDGHGGGKLVRAGQSRWSRRGEEAFLTELAVSANVQRSAAAAGFTAATLYRRRLRDRHFADAWDQALAIGRTCLEAYLVEAADRTFDPDSLTAGADLPTMTIAEAIAVLKLAGKGTGGGKPAAQRGWTGPDSWDDADDEEAWTQARENIIARVGRLREREEEEKLAGGWTRDGDAWVPPGYAPVVDCKALPGAEDEAEVEPMGPRVRSL